MEKVKAYVQRRAYERKSANINVRFIYGNMFYSGIITNLSESGMFIRTSLSLPSNSTFVIIVRIEKNILQVIARLRRIKKHQSNCYGMGVEIMNPSPDYLEFIRSKESAL